MSNCIEVENYDGDTLRCRGKWEICDRCEGSGVHDHPAFSNGISQEEFAEDPDFREDYFRGHYDVRCEECRGSGKVLVPDIENGGLQARAVQDFLNQKARADRAYRAEVQAERRMGA